MAISLNRQKKEEEVLWGTDQNDRSSNASPVVTDNEVASTGNAGGINANTYGGMTPPVVKENTPTVENPLSVETKVEQPTVEAPEKKHLSNTEWLLDEQGMRETYDEIMENAPEQVTEEEERRRLRAAHTAKTVADMGSLVGAFANLYYTNREAPNMDIKYAKPVDYQALHEKWQKSRDTYRTYAQKGRELVWKQALDDIDRRYKTAKAEADLDYKEAQIARMQAKTTAEQEAAAQRAQAALDRQKNVDRNYQLAVDKFNEAKRKASVTEQQKNRSLNQRDRQLSIAEQRERRLANGSSSGGSGGGRGGSKVFKGGNVDYEIPKSTDQSRMENKVIEDMVKRGVIDDNNYITDASGNPITDSNGQKMVDPSKPKKDRTTLVKEMHAKWDDKAETIVRNDYNGSRTRESETAKSAPQPQTKPVYKTSDGKVFEDEAAYRQHQKVLDAKAKKDNSTAAKTEAPKPKAQEKRERAATTTTTTKTTTQKKAETKKEEVVKTSDGKTHKKFSF